MDSFISQQDICSLSDKSSYHMISQTLEAAISDIKYKTVGVNQYIIASILSQCVWNVVYKM